MIWAVGSMGMVKKRMTKEMNDLVLIICIIFLHCAVVVALYFFC